METSNLVTFEMTDFNESTKSHNASASFHVVVILSPTY